MPVPTITLTFAELRAFMADDQYFDMNDDDDPDAGPLNLLTEMSAEVKAIVNDMGLTWTDTDVTFTAWALDRVQALTMIIIWAHESPLPVGGKLWKLLELQGDDDVDYNGGYVSTIADYIAVVAKRKGLINA